MRMIEIDALENGAHSNQTYHGFLPDGYAVVPDDLDTPNYPFGEVAVEVIDDLPTVTQWTALPIPTAPPAPEPEPTEADVTLDLLAEHEERICMLELMKL